MRAENALPRLVAILAFCVAFAEVAIAQSPPFFNVRDYGATGNGTTTDTPAINAAIVAANAAGGGTVTFPSGTYLSVSIHLTNNVTLYLSNNATILAATNGFDPKESTPYSQYQDIGHSYFHDALIWGEGLTNIGFAGPGLIDGGGSLTSGNPGAGQGDKALSLKLCTNVTLTGITITRAGHFGILANGCDNMLVAGIQILNAFANQHRDAFNLINSSDVIISNCVIQGSDDSMCLKSDYALGAKIGGHNIHISNCQILSTQNNATQFGSETVGDFSDVTFSDLTLTGAGKAGIGITSQDGAIIDGVTYNNITMSNCACPIWLKLDYRTTDTPNPSVGRIRNVSIRNVVAYHSTLFNRTNTSTINGYFDGTGTIVPIENITFENVNVSNIGGNPASSVTNVPVVSNDWQPNNFGKWPSYGWYLRYARNISFTNCQTHFDANDDRPAVVVDTVTNVLFDTLKADVGSASPYDARFTNTLNFELTNSTSTGGAQLRLLVTNATAGQIVSPPVFNPVGGRYPGAVSVALACAAPGATIHYTTDGTTPTSTSGTTYSGPLLLSSETVLRAMAYAAGQVDSAVNTAIYSFSGSGAASPTFNPPGGTYAGPQSVALASTMPGASIWYTTDGTVPSSTNGTLYVTNVLVSSSSTIKAVAIVSGLPNSSVSTAAYVITGAAATPSFSPDGGIYPGVQSVTITSATGDASIRYTTDGTTPTPTTGTLYGSPVAISSSLTLRAIAYSSGAANSGVVYANYAILAPLTFEAEALSYTTNGAVAILQNDSNSSGGHWLAFEATGVGQYIEYTLPNIPAGTYDLQMSYKGNTQRGILTFALDGTSLGTTLDQYSSTQTYPVQDYGTVTFATKGNHIVRLTAVGENPSANGYWLSTDRFILALIQPPAPIIGSVSVRPDKTLQFSAVGYPALQYWVYATTNLAGTNWSPVGTATAAGNGALSFTDFAATNLPARFYRFVAP